MIKFFFNCSEIEIVLLRYIYMYLGSIINFYLYIGGIFFERIVMYIIVKRIF